MCCVLFFVGAIFKRLLFGLAFFHAAIQERRKFGPIGWNVRYEWMNADFEVSRKQLKIYLDEQFESAQQQQQQDRSSSSSSSSSSSATATPRVQVPWTHLRELIGEINYCGRVTDYNDKRCVLALLKQFFNPVRDACVCVRVWSGRGEGDGVGARREVHPDRTLQHV